jgi:hypothetical protein
MNNTITLVIQGSKEMTLVGGIFGATFLRPILNSGVSGLEQWVVAADGEQECGKSTLLRGMIEELMPFGSVYFRYDSQKAISFQTVDGVMHRHCDFGWHGYTDKSFKPEIADYASILSLRDTKQTVGVDFLEHAPLQYLNANAVIITIPQQIIVGEYSEVVEKLSLCVDRDSGGMDAVSKFLRLQFTKTKAITGNRLAKKNRRLITITIGNDHPLALECFDNFKRNMTTLSLANS